MSLEEINALLNNRKAKLVVILCHQNADPDALCSAFALSQLFKEIHKDLKVEIAPQGVSKISKKILKAIPIETAAPRIRQADVIFLVDTSTIQQLGSWKAIITSAEKPIVIIDHHALHPETQSLAKLAIIREDATSTCQIVYEMFKLAKISPSVEVAKALFLGIAYDSKHFKIADSNTFIIVSELIELGVDPKVNQKLLSPIFDFSERTARLKAAKRLELITKQNWLIVISYVSSYQASAARALLSMGAHVAIVCGRNKSEFTISMRSSEEFYHKTRIHLGRDIAQPLGKYLKGMGSGHNTAAGVNAKGKFDDMYKKSLGFIQEKMENHFSSHI